jgi:hypothetical protein
MRTAGFEVESGDFFFASLVHCEGMKSIAVVGFSTVRKPVFAIHDVTWPNRSSRDSISILLRFRSASS